LMSANSAVTVLRSPSAASADASAGGMTRTADADSTGVDSGAAALSDVPQSEQNFAPDGLSEPHFEHRFDNGLPHSAQNFLPALLSVPQFVQRIGLSYRENTHFCSTCAREAIYAHYCWVTPLRQYSLQLL
jgi:hypothetical protein